MSGELAFYKEFVDDLVGIRPCVQTKWVTGKGWPKVPENEDINAFVQALSPTQKQLLCRLLQEARDGGIHDTLAYLSGEMMDGLSLAKGDIRLPVEPFDTELYFDWVCRCQGEPWPDQRQTEGI